MKNSLRLVFLYAFVAAQCALAIRMEVTPHFHLNDTPNAFNVRCLPQNHGNCDKKIVLVQIYKTGNRKIASLQPTQVISIPPQMKSSVVADGHIDQENVGNSFLSVTVRDAVKEDSGLYTCSAILMDESGNTTEVSASQNIKIENRDVQDVVRDLMKRVSLVEEIGNWGTNVTVGQLSHLVAKSDTVERKCNSLSENLVTIGDTLISIKNRIRENQNEMAGYKSKIADQERQLTALQEQNTRESFMTAFSYGMRHTVTVTTGETIRFTDHINNKGTDYNPLTGVFTAPVDGFYVFHLSVDTKRKDREIKIDVKANGQRLVSLYIFDADHPDQSSVSTMVELRRGGKVQCVLREISSGNDLEDWDHYSVFTGYLLKRL